MNKQRLLILYDYFDPAYKAGGPIRSLVNLVRNLEQEMEIFVLTTNQDHDGALLKVPVDSWTPYGANSKVKYLSKHNRKYACLKNTIGEINPDTIYINGMFSLFFVIFPLKLTKRLKGIKTVIAPRGMLQPNALAIKPAKKAVYLKLLKWFLMSKDLIWQATTANEQKDMKEYLGMDVPISLVANVPSFNAKLLSDLSARNDVTVFGTVALISPMKNIHYALLALGNIHTSVEYRIYGPVKDQAYWNDCQQIIKALPSNINVVYEGEILPEDVPGKIKTFDFYLQPSRSENFGHSIFEAFNHGVPVIISDQTPWRDLVDKHAGWDVDLFDSSSLTAAIQEALAMDDAMYKRYQLGARGIAEEYMQQNDFLDQYRALFSLYKNNKPD